MTIEHNIQGVVFTSTALSNPILFDVGDFSYGIPSVLVHNQPHEPARLSIGKFCTIAHNVEIILGSYHRADTFTIFPFSAPHLGNLFSSTRHIIDYSCTKGSVRIGNDIWIGTGTKILSGVSIGDGAVIEAGSIVTHDVGAYEIWAGNPASFRKYRFEKDVSDRLLKLRWWDWPKAIIEENAREIMSSSEAALVKLESVKQSLLIARNTASAPFHFVMGYSGFLRIFRPSYEPNKPNLVVLHGSLGAIESVLGGGKYIKNANLIYIDLPGCGQSSQPSAMSVTGFAIEVLAAIKEVIGDESYQFLGVSFGGSVALDIATNDSQCKGVFLIDTPFSTKKLWHVHQFFRYMLTKSPDNQYQRNFAHKFYGVTEANLIDLDYWYLLNNISVPVIVITGNIEIDQIRDVSVYGYPCCLDDNDLIRLKEWGAEIIQISGGHDLINENSIEVAKIVDKFIANIAL
jgi:acetyltransferase-like isoleucine patch superfamily enzyme/pimeloyl-ACP methyl ester carboxylesterase